MCGIAGELLFKPAKVVADWKKISQLMKLRGPDDSGFWSDDRCCTFVFRRLSILDLNPTGHQPMLSADGRYVLVFNGEVYNFRELRAELVSQGISFRSSGDSEVVLQSLILWGKKALDKFNGMFALGFYDREAKKLLIARDHAGIKPLYYLHTSSGLVFASQYDQILAHPMCKGLRVSQDALAIYLRLAFIPAPYAILENTFMLEPGSWLEVGSDGATKQGHYYSFPKFESPLLTGGEAIEAVNAAIDNSVKRQMVSDVPVAAFLSGGIDSPLVVSKMKSLGGLPSLKAFTIGTSDDSTDESSDAAEYAKEIGVEQVIEKISSKQAFSMLDEVTNSCGEPFGDFSIFPTSLVCRLASKDYKVILSGDGGDELFWGYAKRFTALTKKSNDFRHSHFNRSLLWGAKKHLGIGGMSYEARRFKTIGDWQKSKHTHLSEQILDSLFPSLPNWPENYQTFDFSGWKQDETAQWLRWNEFNCHLSMVLLKVDRASMGNSLEVRVPLLDREVIDVAAQIDWRSCLNLESGIGKLPLRKCLSKHVQYQTQGKRGFGIPMGDWLKSSLRPVFEDLLIDKSDLLGLEINQKASRDLFDKHLSGTKDYGWGLWPLLSLALWEKRFYTS